MPGSRIVWPATVIASEATTKNQPPDTDIIMFQTSFGMRVRHFEPPEPLPGRQMVHPRRLAQIVRHGAKGLVEAERHVPGLRGEDREDRGAFVAEQAARETAR